jgi:replication factor A2
LPLSIKQILVAQKEEDIFKVDGQELHTVKLIGVVERIVDQSTSFTFVLNDGSGVIECKQWMDKDATSVSSTSRIR